MRLKKKFWTSFAISLILNSKKYKPTHSYINLLNLFRSKCLYIFLLFFYFNFYLLILLFLVHRLINVFYLNSWKTIP